MSKKKTKHRNRASPWKIFGILVILGALGWGIFALARSMRLAISTTTAAPVTTTTTTTDIQAEILMGTIERITRANVRILVGTTLGSGTVIDEDDTYYYAITNYHVIASVGDLSIRTWDGVEGLFEVLASDEDLDLVMIRFPKAGRGMIIPLEFNLDPDAHDPVVSIGFPTDELTITFGIFEGFGTYRFEDVIHDIILHSAAISGGSSGGALVDLHGNLLGINTWKLGDCMYAIPAFVVQGFIESNPI